MAVVASHTVHIAVLPDASLLGSDFSPMKLKTFQLGPTAHIVEEAPVVSVLWHPLGYRGRCVVTVTSDAIVRLWDVNRTDRSSFNEPSLSVDLKKLANASSASDSLGASRFGVAKGFSPDAAELEIASASFCCTDQIDSVHGWTAMTLWLATREGDVYALCPLLPAKWQLEGSPSESPILQTLSTSIHAEYESPLDDEQSSFEIRPPAKQQLSWLLDIMHEDPPSEEVTEGKFVNVYSRSKSSPVYPLLQGPFVISPELDDVEISDMLVFPLQALSMSSSEQVHGVPAAVICLLARSGTLFVGLDLEGVEGRWLPSERGEIARTGQEHEVHVVEKIELRKDRHTTLPLSHSVTWDPRGDYALFITHDSGVHRVCMDPWLHEFENELSEAQSQGAELRLGLLLSRLHSQVDHVLPLPKAPARSPDDVASCVLMDEPCATKSYLLTTLFDEPYTAQFEQGEDENAASSLLELDTSSLTQNLHSRLAYQPAKELWEPLGLPSLLSRAPAPLTNQTLLAKPVLELVLATHRMTSQETSRLGFGVAEIFRRSKWLADEFRDLLVNAAELASKIDQVTGDDEESYTSTADGIEGMPLVGTGRITLRMEKVEAEQDRLGLQSERIRKKLATAARRALSEKEKDWIQEIEALDRSLQNLEDRADGAGDEEASTQDRIEELQQLKERLVADAHRELGKGAGTTGTVSGPRKEDYRQVEALLERLSALIETETQKLRSMGIFVPAQR